MAITTNALNYAGNLEINDGVQLAFDTMLNTPVPGGSQPAVICGTGTPTFSSIKGTLYINLTGSSASTRMFINNGTTTWIAVTTAS